MNACELAIGARRIGLGHRCFVMAEIGLAHDGSLGTAHAYIEAVAKSGADAIKFQTHIAAAESTPSEPFRIKFSPQDDTRYDYWRRMEFTEPQWRGLMEHAQGRGLIFLSTPFSMEAVALLDRLGVPAWKVGSGDVSNLPMLEQMAGTDKPVLLSTGMSDWGELDAAVAVINSHRTPVAILQCTTAYPCPPERLGLNLIGEMRERYRCPVGLSDHSGTIYAGLAAAALGANLLEVHVVFSRECFGPDVSASVTTGELKQLVDGVRFIEKTLANPVNKDQLAAELTDLREIFGKSIVLSKDLDADHILTEHDLVLKKPGTGLPPAKLHGVLGRRLTKSVRAGSLLSQADLQ